MRAVLTAALVAAFVAVGTPARAQGHAPLGPYEAVATTVGRPSFFVGGGWPFAGAGLDFGVNDALGLGLRAGYLWASPHAGFRLASGVLVEVPARLLVHRAGAIEIAVTSTPGLVVGTDRRISTIGEDVAPELSVLAPRLDVGVLVSWPLSPTLVLKLGVEVPATLVLAMPEPPVADALELTIAFSPVVGLAWAATGWLTLFVHAAAGPALVWAPTAWTSDGWAHEVRVDGSLRATAGVVFTPWR